MQLVLQQLTYVTIHQTLPETTELRRAKYLNNIVEQDHRFMKRRQSRHGIWLVQYGTKNFERLRSDEHDP